MRINADVILNEEPVFLENTSEVYKNSSIWKTKKCGDIKIIGLLEKRKNVHIFLVEFEDGTRIKARHYNIKNGSVNNPYHYGNVCGVACLGMANSKHFLYAHWNQMIRRCYDTKHIRYTDYGGRGIRVCQRWLCFEYFLNDVQKMNGFELLKDGRKYQLDRIDNNCNYSLNNCRIVSAANNSRNKRNNIFVKVILNGVVDYIGCAMDVSKEYNIDRTTLRKRLRSGSVINNLYFETANENEVKQWQEKHMQNFKN